MKPGPSNEFPWISIWPLAKPYADYCVVIPKARGCVRWTVSIVQAKELVVDRVWKHLIKAQGCTADKSLVCRRIISSENMSITARLMQLWKCFTVSPLQSACPAMHQITVQGPGGVTTSPTSLDPVLVWSQQNSPVATGGLWWA